MTESARTIFYATPPAERARLERRALSLATGRLEPQARKFFELATFRRANHIFAIESHFVAEVGRLHNFTPLPQVPPYFAGVTNLRGEILPLVDIHLALGLPNPGLTDLSRMIALQHPLHPPLGLIVDEVYEVCTVPQNQLTHANHIAELGEAVPNWILGLLPSAQIVLSGEKILSDPTFHQS